MTIRTKILLTVLAMVVSFAAGNYTAQRITKTESVKSVDSTDTTIKTTTTTTTTKDKEGKETTTTKTDTITAIKEKEVIKSNKNETEVSKRALLNVSLLGAITQNESKPIYGISVSKSFIGPITMGAFGLTNGIFGISIGLNF